MAKGSAAVMARVANASVSADLHSIDETLMGCLANFLNKVIKHTIYTCNRHSTHQISAFDFRSLKKIFEDANKNGWNQYFLSSQTVSKILFACAIGTCSGQ